MRFLVLSDIHANLTALDASLAAVEGRWERILCLGDIVDYGPDPNEVTERVKALDPIIIRGNHDKVVARGLRTWTISILSRRLRRGGPAIISGLTTPLILRNCPPAP